MYNQDNKDPDNYNVLSKSASHPNLSLKVH